MIRSDDTKILYIGGTIPVLSETFVYREIFALRNIGYQIFTASVHRPERDLGEEKLEQLAEQTIGIYGRGAFGIFVDLLVELVGNPKQTLGTIFAGLSDALSTEVHHLTSRPKVIVQNLAAISLARRVRKMGIRHIHSHMAHLPTTIAMYCAQQLNIGFSFTGHAVDMFQYRILLEKKLRKALFASCISYWHRAFYKELVANNDDHYPIVRCGVDPTWFDIAKIASGDTLNILSVGRLIEKKGFDVLIEALAMIHKEKRIDFRCTVLGGGPEYSNLQNQISLHGLSEQVQLFGSVNNNEIPRFMQSADLFALPCKVSETGDKDGIPVALMEAMAAGICVLAGDIPSLRELVRDGETGLIVEPGNAASVKRAIERIAADRELGATLSAQGRILVKEEFSVETNAGRIAEAFESVIAEKGGRGGL